MSLETEYKQHWDDKFSSREWGRYPPEDLVRFMGRNFKHLDHSAVAVLEVGCGPGANIWFLHREGYQVAGIDGSAAAIAQAEQRLKLENDGQSELKTDLKVGDFSTLPWQANSFDVVIDIFAIYANTASVIDKTLAEVSRVLKPGGRFFAKMWGTKTTGFGEGKKIETHTFDEVPFGPCYEMGMTHFFDKTEIRRRFDMFRIDAIDTIERSDAFTESHIEEIICQCTKPADSQNVQ